MIQNIIWQVCCDQCYILDICTAVQSMPTAFWLVHLKIFLLGKPMIDPLVKESRELLKDKENESTWFKVFTLFEKLSKAFETKDQVVEFFPKFADIVHRSIQSDRSRLNGISLGFLKQCAEIAKNGFSFNTFVGPVLRLTGRSNKVFVSRAMDTLESLCKYADPRCLLKNINDNIDSANKNVRLASYSIASWRIRDNYGLFGPLIERGMRDPAQEVRNICKSVARSREAPSGNDVEIKKNTIANLTPRKSFKVDKSHEEIKKIEHEVVKITKEQLARKPIQQNFFERLNQLKKERHALLEKKEDDLTPRKLDRYLNKYRCKSPDSLGLSVTKSKTSSNQTCILKDSMHRGEIRPAVLISGHSKSVGTEESAASTTKLQKPSEETHISFVHETLPFKKEMDSPSHKDASIIHEPINTSITRQEIKSDDAIRQEEDMIEDCDGLLVQDSLLAEGYTGLSHAENDAVSDLSRSFAGIAIEPFKCYSDFAKDGTENTEQEQPADRDENPTECQASPPKTNQHSLGKSMDDILGHSGDKTVHSGHASGNVNESAKAALNGVSSATSGKDFSSRHSIGVNCAAEPKTHADEGTLASGTLSKGPQPIEHSLSFVLDANTLGKAGDINDVASSDRLEMGPSAIIGLYKDECKAEPGCRLEPAISNEHLPEDVSRPQCGLAAPSNVDGTKTRILVDDDLDGVIGTDLDILQAEHPDRVGNSVVLGNVVTGTLGKDDVEGQGSLFGTEDNRTLALNTVDDEGVQDVFCPEMSSKLSTHKLFDENIFGSDEEDASKSIGMANKPVFSIPIRVVSESACISGRLSLDSKQDTMLDNASQGDRELDRDQ